MLSKLLVLAGFVVLQAFMARLHLPLLRRAIPPNDSYGLRTAATRSDPAVWYEANARSARESLWSSAVLTALVGALAFVPRWDAVTHLLWSVGLRVATIGLGAVRGVRMARRLALARIATGAADAARTSAPTQRPA